MTIHVTDPFQRQAELEIEMTGLAKASYWSRVNKNLDKDRGASTTPGRYMTRNALIPLGDAITAFITEVYSGKPGPRNVAARLTKDMDPYVVSYLVTRATLNQLMRKNSVGLLTLGRTIARDLEAEARFEQFAKENPSLYARVEKGLSDDGASEQHKRMVLTYAMGKFDIPWARWSKQEMVHLGIKMVELFCENTGLAVLNQAFEGESKDAPRDQYRVELAPKVTSWVSQSLLKGEALLPPHMPMIIPPRDWAGLMGGGYYTDAVRPIPLVRKARPAQIALLKEAHLGAVYAGLNAIQKTAWQINVDVLNTMRTLILGGVGIAGLVQKNDIPLPERPFDIDTNPQALQEWKWAARDTYSANIELGRDRLQQAGLIQIAERFEAEPTIYFPHNIDFRGRAYPIPQVLHPQGADNAKGLLRFAEGKPLGEDGERWLAIHGANTFGVDKVSFDARVAWVETNWKSILQCADDPFGDLWWTEADKPWCFLAFCFEYAGWRRSGSSTTFVSHLPIALDGSCNGLQHFSAMLLDSVGGRAVNLIPADKPQDIYQVVADRVMAQLRAVRPFEGMIAEEVETGAKKKKGPTAEQIARWSHEWVHFGIDRKTTKRPVMVLPYGGTPRSCMRYVEDSVKERIRAGQTHNFGDELKQATGYLASTIWVAIGDVVIAAKEAMGWLQSTARVVGKKNLPLHWTTPSGFVAYQSYMTMKGRRIETKIAGSIVKPRDYTETDQVNVLKQATSISPNFVHSLDASAMILTVDALSGDGLTSFAMIHDSYGTHACDTTRLANKLREVFISMYETDPLMHFRDQLVAHVGPDLINDIKQLPQKGTLDLNQIMKADFFFA